MTQKQFVAYGLIVILSGTLIVAITEPLSEDNWYALAGVGMFVFGIWSSVLLLKK